MKIFFSSSSLDVLDLDHMKRSSTSSFSIELRKINLGNRLDPTLTLSRIFFILAFNITILKIDSS